MKTKNFYAVILAGGSGTRFWPLSRQSLPKQFLNVTGERTLFQETLDRLQSLVTGQRIVIVTNQQHQKKVLEQVKKYRVPKENILLEPSGKNTAPAICWAAVHIHQRDPEAVMAVLPSDHLIAHQGHFIKVLKQAIKHAENNYLVTMGIVPSRPETGYGYLKTKKSKGMVLVDRFTEKPQLAVAKRFVKNKNYLWNSGMFVWKTEVILNEFQKHLPQIYRLIQPCRSKSAVHKVWPKLQGVSIDYGILEKADQVAAVPAQDIGWSDLGSWESLAENLKADRQGNIARGDVMNIETQNSLIFGSQKFVATIGLDHVVIVDTPDALLVCRKDMSQDVKKIVEQLKLKKRPEC